MTTSPTGGKSMLYPSRSVVTLLAGYVVAGFLATVALGDLGDIGFWIVWIPMLLATIYLMVAGVVRLFTRRPNGSAA